jgi:D-3-phosphoglycerate dehydrogenase / 2-oxoglutarate reductase
MLALARNSLAADRAVRENHAEIRNSLIGFELLHKTLGIVGLGAIGSRVAAICAQGFDMQVIVFDPFLTDRESRHFMVFARSLAELLGRADVLTLHVPLNDNTRHLIDADALARMKRSGLLVNTARGAVVDTLALANVLKDGLIRGAALDVFEEEPLPRNHPLLSAPNTIFSPHIAGSTKEAREEMSKLVAHQVLQVLRGERPEFLANPGV